MLFIHGEDDPFIFPHHASDMYEVSQGIKQIHIVPGAAHAESILAEPEQYREHVKEFLDGLRSKRNGSERDDY